MPGPSPRLVACALLLGLGLAAPRAAAYEPPPPLPAYLAPPPPAAAAPPPDPLTVEIMPRAGFVYRFSGASTLPLTERYGGVVGLGAAIAPWTRAAIALRWEHALVGSEHNKGDVADVSVSRSLDTIWASLRLYLVRTPRLALLAELGPGLAIQHASASVLVYPTDFTRSHSYNCSESGGPGLGLRAGLGFEARLAGPLWITAEGVLDNVHLSTDPLGDCAPGAGTLSLVGLRLGLTYRRDVSRWLR
jgi:hypothetical protein